MNAIQWTVNIVINSILVSTGVHLCVTQSDSDPVWALAVFAGVWLHWPGKWPCLARPVLRRQSWQYTCTLHSPGQQSRVRGAGDTRFRVHLYTNTTIILTFQHQRRLRRGNLQWHHPGECREKLWCPKGKVIWLSRVSSGLICCQVTLVTLYDISTLNHPPGQHANTPA